MIITAMQDLEQSATHQLRMIVGLREPAGSYSGTESCLPGMGNRGDIKITDGLVFTIRIGAAAGEQAEEM
jgi:hypothetical protein